jgi:hypothetical protein
VKVDTYRPLVTLPISPFLSFLTSASLTSDIWATTFIRLLSLFFLLFEDCAFLLSSSYPLGYFAIMTKPTDPTFYFIFADFFMYFKISLF